jgi:hypothetical protein
MKNIFNYLRGLLILTSADYMYFLVYRAGLRTLLIDLSAVLAAVISSLFLPTFLVEIIFILLSIHIMHWAFAYYLKWRVHKQKNYLIHHYFDFVCFQLLLILMAPLIIWILITIWFFYFKYAIIVVDKMTRDQRN